MLTVVAGIIMLGILVFIHEFGHFCVAKLAGVKVLKFSLGFGPKLASKRWGDTEYMICAVPLGGYVQMLGEGNGEQEDQAELSPEEQEHSFANQPVSRRMAIVAAGPFMNLLLPFVILPLAYLVGVHLPAFLDRAPCVGYVAEESAAQRAGFASGDCIQALNGARLDTWNEANKALVSHAGEQLNFVVERAGREVTLTVPSTDSTPEGLQALGLAPRQEAAIGSITAGSPAERAGLQPGDRIVALDGVAIHSWYELRPKIQETGGKPVQLTLERNGEAIQREITPVQTEKDGDYLLGVTPLQEMTFKRFGPVAALKAGSERASDLIGLTLVFLRKLVAGQISAKSIGGPITVVQIAGQAAQTDLAAILTVLAFLSIQLGILNLLPIPILDGGHLFFNFFELILRRPLSLRAREIAQQIGLVLIILLMILAFYNDLMRLFFWGE